MSNQSNHISHEGIIVKTEGDTVFVRILVKSGCASCEIKGACSMADMEEKIIEVRENYEQYTPGQKVMISMKSSLGYTALFYAYLLPFLIVLISLIAGISIIKNEGLSALISFVLVSFYYIGLYFFKDRLQRVFTYQLTTLS